MNMNNEIQQVSRSKHEQFGKQTMMTKYLKSSKTTSVIALAAILAVVMSICSRQEGCTDLGGGSETTETEAPIRDLVCTEYRYSVSRTSDREELDFRVFCGDELVFSSESELMTNFEFLLVDSLAKQTYLDPASLENEPSAGRFENDIDNDGIPEVYISESDETGVIDLTVLLIAPRFRVIKLRDYEGPEFVDVDSDGALELKTRDLKVLEDWRHSIDPPEVILTFLGGRAGLSKSSRMGYSKRVVDAKAKTIAKEIAGTGELPDEAAEMMLELFYGGRAGLAFRYFDHATTGINSGSKFALENEFVLQLVNSSSFFEELMDLNGLTYSQPEGEGADPEGASRDRFIGIRPSKFRQ